MTKFKVGDMVRVKPLRSIQKQYQLAVGDIVAIGPQGRVSYVVKIKGTSYLFAEDELEKV